MGFGILLIFALVGGIIGILFGFDPSKIAGQIGAGIFALASIPFILVLSTTTDPNASASILTRYVEFWSDNFVEAVMGEVAGQFAGSILRTFK